ncbi:MAG: ATP-binding protein, partial [Gaiellaceae bacterium]
AIFPARFVLVGTMNLCPCGARGDPAAECACSPQRLAAYQAKLSRALLDRFDLVLHLPRPRSRELDAAPGEPSKAVRERVEAGAARFREGVPRLGSEGRTLLARAVDTLPLSARGRARVLRVAGTIAALAGAEEVGTEHVAEALSYRAPREVAL